MDQRRTQGPLLEERQGLLRLSVPTQGSPSELIAILSNQCLPLVSMTRWARLREDVTEPSTLQPTSSSSIRELASGLFG